MVKYQSDIVRINFETPFKHKPGEPKPLSLRIKRRVRFGECDPMGVVWHGHYPVFFEQAREALANACDIGFRRLKEAKIMLPVKNLCMDYCRPLFFDNDYIVEASIHWANAARVNTTYKIVTEQGELCTQAFSVLLMVDLKGCLILEPPSFYVQFLEKWAAGTLPPLSKLDIASA